MKKLYLLFALLPAVVSGQSVLDAEMERIFRDMDWLDTLGFQVAPVREVSSRRGVVEEVGKAAVLMRAMPEGNKQRAVTAYRVEIFSDNTAAARERAYAAYAKFRELCPDISTEERRDIRYNSPKYTVRVGAFLTHEEALALCGRIGNTFQAYIRTEQMPLATFLYRTYTAPVERVTVPEGE